MKKCKRFKDPVYGYIDIDETIISDVIDTPCFQRLRDVIQTSYSPLYTSALHNRFVHSLGVYYLGRIVSDSILQRKDEYRDVIGIDRYMELFELACLM